MDYEKTMSFHLKTKSQKFKNKMKLHRKSAQVITNHGGGA